jgi:GNAT superfamily N-acetyltransferase
MRRDLLDWLHVRQARREDVETLVRFNVALAWETEGRRLDEARLRRGVLAVFDTPMRGFYMVAELLHQSPGLVIGQLLVTFEWSDWRNATFWWIQSVYVDPAWRRQGVYGKMHEVILEQARRRDDVCGLRLYVEQANTIAQRVYEKVGLTLAPYRMYEVDFVLPRKPLSPLGSDALVDHREDP